MVESEIYKSLISLLEATGMSMFKPDGGFWTSTLRPDQGSDWLDYARCINRMPRDSSLFVYDVSPDARILEIRDGYDVLHSIDATSHLGIDASASVSMSEGKKFWTKVVDQYDAIHVPEDHRHKGCLYQWDAESTIWFRPNDVLTLREIIPVKA